MKIVLRKESNIPYYQQIYMQIVERVQSGMLSHGDSLPSLRSMAEDLQISLLTVRKAYKQLEKKEYIRIEQGKGAYIQKHVKQNFKTIPYKWQQTKTIKCYAISICNESAPEILRFFTSDFISSFIAKSILGRRNA